MSSIIPFDYDGQFVRFTEDGWINATDIAKRFGKRPSHWLELPATKEYLSALARHLNAGKSGNLVVSSKGRNGGTWLHPKLAVHFARWLDVDFAVWADMHLDAVLRGSGNALQEYERAHKTLETRKAKASEQGRGLAEWRRQKTPLHQQVEYWQEQLQMTLPIEDEAA